MKQAQAQSNKSTTSIKTSIPIVPPIIQQDDGKFNTENGKY
jgi:hypothetical protein